jgi:hypothetical protein
MEWRRSDQPIWVDKDEPEQLGPLVVEAELFMIDEQGLIIFQDQYGSHGMTPEAYEQYMSSQNGPPIHQ